eukprot:TRINITY_DN11291_c0_g1::TRINITY_DN11291_c0_g1_i1::g.726::m.726 TRINITY_DN11291_c0_g1::TRINITY_DN11291_c0_g1_i1::g.726  ORF type:complete len:220 (+),score=26.38,sp/Q3TWN3/CNNM2_MOUSE/35.62/4e-20,CBS/PF00571.23/0.063,CBS/PF00571.23/0.00028 TRINITY_DN11291_c0_g1_i1:359-1018(+)
MTPIDRVYMVPSERILDRNLLEEVLAQGYSRVPVFKGGRAKITGVLLIKDLLLFPLDVNMTVGGLVSKANRNMLQVDEDLEIRHLITMFKTGFSHMAIVTRGPGKVMGIITLEDVLAQLLDDDLIEESELFQNVNRTKSTADRAPPSFQELQQMIELTKREEMNADSRSEPYDPHPSRKPRIQYNLQSSESESFSKKHVKRMPSVPKTNHRETDEHQWR